MSAFQNLDIRNDPARMLRAVSRYSSDLDGLGPIPAWISPELIAETRAVWSPFYGGKELTDAEILALLIRVGVLYEILYSDGGSDESKDSDE